MRAAQYSYDKHQITKNHTTMGNADLPSILVVIHALSFQVRLLG